MSKVFSAALLAFILAQSSLYALGGKEQKKEAKMYSQREGGIVSGAVVTRPPAPGTPLPEVEITGTVRLVGSGPGTELVISGDISQWHIENAEQNKVRDLQQQVIIVKAKTYTVETTFSSGRKMTRRYLRDLTVLSP